MSFCISDHLYKAFRLEPLHGAPSRILRNSTHFYHGTLPPSGGFSLNALRRFKFSRKALANRSSFWAALSAFVPVLAGDGFVGPFVMSIIFYHRLIREGLSRKPFGSFGRAFYRSLHHVQVRERTTN